MTRRLALALAVLGLVAGGGAGLYAAMRPPPARGPVAPAPSAPPPASGVAPAPASGPGPRPGAVLGVADAVRELDLIRPSRPKMAEDFTVPLLYGQTFRLADHRGRVVLLNFWATWCPPCREEMPAMERLWRRQKEAGFVMVALSVDADPAVVAPFVTERGLTFAIGLDSKMDVANAYGVRGLPSTFVVDRQGQVAAFAIGPRAWDTDAAHSLVEGLGR